MKNEKKTVVKVSFLFPLQVVLLILKFAGVVNWAWWIILLPLIINTILSVISLIIFCIVTYIAEKNKFWDDIINNNK